MVGTALLIAAAGATGAAVSFAVVMAFLHSGAPEWPIVHRFVHDARNAS